MRRFIRLWALCTSVLSVVAPRVGAQTGVAYDFRMRDSSCTASGTSNIGESTGHAVWSQGRVRFEMTGNFPRESVPGFTPGRSTVLILSDTGRSVVMLDPEKKQYVKFDPSGMMEGMQKVMESMGGKMTMEMTGDDPKVENLGAGPDVMGHHTSHWRISSDMSVKVGVMGQSQETRTATVADEYVATDVPHVSEPFHGLVSSPLSEMFGSSAKTYFAKLAAARSKMPVGAPLRSEMHMKTTSAGKVNESNTVMEITNIKNITATPDIFAIPADYTQMEFPMSPHNMRDSAMKH
ncbi:MAG TPA: hypothetical protein VNC11_10900 [Gemmatimonadaceae bacterium]|jgi:hypothetical protein|nr:hypothetical protein [Gemmatimonadaceae bacterium]